MTIARWTALLLTVMVAAFLLTACAMGGESPRTERQRPAGDQQAGAARTVGEDAGTFVFIHAQH